MSRNTRVDDRTLVGALVGWAMSWERERPAEGEDESEAARTARSNLEAMRVELLRALSAADVPAPPPNVVAMHDLAAAVARLNLRLDAIAADVALLRSMADAQRQADGRASFPAPRGWVR